MIDDDIDDCDCEKLLDDFTALRTEHHVDVTVGKVLAMLGFVKRMSGKFRDP
jgi:hypothetical protein